MNSAVCCKLIKINGVTINEIPENLIWGIQNIFNSSPVTPQIRDNRLLYASPGISDSDCI